MSERRQLGMRASFVLGMLVGRTRTVDELYALIQSGADEGLVDDLDQELWGHPAVAFRALAEGGPDEVRQLLARLEEFGFASHVELERPGGRVSEIWTGRIPD